MDDDDDAVSCATYTHARRHPMVLGNIGGWTPPFQLSLVQLGTVVAVYFVEFRTWPLWGAHLPRVPAVIVALGLPWLLAWAVRHTRIEGRSLPRLALGVVMLLSAPAGGTVRGRAYRPPRPSAPLASPIYVAPGDLP
ncbi:MAG TPA: TcpE family conjugal transfer membrane protein [Acidimicrobiales bacterium]|nr:TcpE family conjugal transfer membrane protein [Acidimicrobiales bacterium]